MAARVPLVEITAPKERIRMQVGDKRLFVKHPDPVGGNVRTRRQHGIQASVFVGKDTKAKCTKSQGAETDYCYR